MKLLRLFVVVGIFLSSVSPVFAQDTCAIERRVDEDTGIATLSTSSAFRFEFLREHVGAFGEGHVCMVLAFNLTEDQLRQLAAADRGSSI